MAKNTVQIDFDLNIKQALDKIKELTKATKDSMKGIDMSPETKKYFDDILAKVTELEQFLIKVSQNNNKNAESLKKFKDETQKTFNELGQSIKDLSGQLNDIDNSRIFVGMGIQVQNVTEKVNGLVTAFNKLKKVYIPIVQAKETKNNIVSDIDKQLGNVKPSKNIRTSSAQAKPKKQTDKPQQQQQQQTEFDYQAAEKLLSHNARTNKYFDTLEIKELQEQLQSLIGTYYQLQKTIDNVSADKRLKVVSKLQQAIVSQELDQVTSILDNKDQKAYNEALAKSFPSDLKLKGAQFDTTLSKIVSGNLENNVKQYREKVREIVEEQKTISSEVFQLKDGRVEIPVEFKKKTLLNLTNTLKDIVGKLQLNVLDKKPLEVPITFVSQQTSKQREEVKEQLQQQLENEKKQGEKATEDSTNKVTEDLTSVLDKSATEQLKKLKKYSKKVSDTIIKDLGDISKVVVKPIIEPKIQFNNEQIDTLNRLFSVSLDTDKINEQANAVIKTTEKSVSKVADIVTEQVAPAVQAEAPSTPKKVETPKKPTYNPLNKTPLTPELEKEILDRWELLSNADLGTEVNRQADIYNRWFKLLISRYRAFDRDEHYALSLREYTHEKYDDEVGKQQAEKYFEEFGRMARGFTIGHGTYNPIDRESIKLYPYGYPYGQSVNYSSTLDLSNLKWASGATVDYEKILFDPDDIHNQGRDWRWNYEEALGQDAYHKGIEAMKDYLIDHHGSLNLRNKNEKDMLQSLLVAYKTYTKRDNMWTSEDDVARMDQEFINSLSEGVYNDQQKKKLTKQITDQLASLKGEKFEKKQQELKERIHNLAVEHLPEPIAWEEPQEEAKIEVEIEPKKTSNKSTKKTSSKKITEVPKQEPVKEEIESSVTTEDINKIIQASAEQAQTEAAKGTKANAKNNAKYDITELNALSKKITEINDAVLSQPEAFKKVQEQIQSSIQSIIDAFKPLLDQSTVFKSNIIDIRGLLRAKKPITTPEGSTQNDENNGNTKTEQLQTELEFVQQMSKLQKTLRELAKESIGTALIKALTVSDKQLEPGNKLIEFLQKLETLISKLSAANIPVIQDLKALAANSKSLNSLAMLFDETKADKVTQIVNPKIKTDILKTMSTFRDNNEQSPIYSSYKDKLNEYYSQADHTIDEQTILNVRDKFNQLRALYETHQNYRATVNDLLEQSLKIAHPTKEQAHRSKVLTDYQKILNDTNGQPIEQGWLNQIQNVLQHYKKSIPLDLQKDTLKSQIDVLQQQYIGQVGSKNSAIMTLKTLSKEITTAKTPERIKEIQGIYASCSKELLKNQEFIFQTRDWQKKTIETINETLEDTKHWGENDPTRLDLKSIRDRVPFVGVKDIKTEIDKDLEAIYKKVEADLVHRPKPLPIGELRQQLSDKLFDGIEHMRGIKDDIAPTNKQDIIKQGNEFITKVKTAKASDLQNGGALRKALDAWFTSVYNNIETWQTLALRRMNALQPDLKNQKLIDLLDSTEYIDKKNEDKGTIGIDYANTRNNLINSIKNFSGTNTKTIDQDIDEFEKKVRQRVNWILQIKNIRDRIVKMVTKALQSYSMDNDDEKFLKDILSKVNKSESSGIVYLIQQYKDGQRDIIKDIQQKVNDVRYGKKLPVQGYRSINEIENYLPSIAKQLGGTHVQNIQFKGNTHELVADMEMADKTLKRLQIRMDSANQPRYIITAQKSVKTLGLNIDGLVNKGLKFLALRFSGMRGIYALRNALETLRQVDTALTTMSYTMDISETKLNALGASVLKMANDMKVSLADANAVATIYANKNITPEEIIETSTPTLVLRNLTNTDAATAADQIQAVMEQFELGSDQAAHIVDVYDYISGQIAVDYSQGIKSISEAVQVAGLTAQQAGMSYEQLSAIVANAVEKTRMMGSQIGNGLKTIMVRLSKVGELTGEVDNATLSRASKSLHQIGVEVYNTNGSYREFDVIMGELAQKWDDLSDAEKSNISFNIAATRQTNLLSAILTDYKESMQMATEAAVTHGNAMENQEKYLDSYNGRLQGLKTSLDTMWTHLLDSSATKGVISFLTNVIQLTDKLTDSLGSVNTILLAITARQAIKGQGLFQFDTDGHITSIFKKIKQQNLLNNALYDIQQGLPDFIKKTVKVEGLASTEDKDIRKKFTDFRQGIDPKKPTMISVPSSTGNGVVQQKMTVEMLDAVEAKLFELKKDGKSIDDIGTSFHHVNIQGSKTVSMLKDIGINMGVMLAISIAINLAAKAWDKLNITVEEAQEKLSNTQQSFNNIQNEINELNGKAKLSDAERERLAYLKQRLDYEKQTLDIQQRQLYTQQLGREYNITDYFDKDSDVYKRTFGYDEYDYRWRSINNKNGKVNRLINEYLSDSDKLSPDHYITEKERTKITEHQRGLESQLLEHYGSIWESREQANKEIEQHENMLNSGLLVGKDIERAQRGLEEAQKQFDFTTQLLNSIQDAIHPNVTAKDKIEEHLSKQGLDQGEIYNMYLGKNFNSQELDILASVDLGEAKTIDDLKKILKEAQKVADDTPITVDTQVKKIIMSSQGLKSLSAIYQDVKDKGTFNYDSLVSEDFLNEFSNYPAFENFMKIVSTSPKDLQACQGAFNQLATEWLAGSGILANVTEDTQAFTIALLEQMGVTNASEILQKQLGRYYIEQGAAARQAGEDSSIYESKLQELGMSSQTASYFIKLTQFALNDVNGADLDLSGKIEQFNDLAASSSGAAANMGLALSMSGIDEKEFLYNLRRDPNAPRRLIKDDNDHFIENPLWTEYANKILREKIQKRHALFMKELFGQIKFDPPDINKAGGGGGKDAPEAYKMELTALRKYIEAYEEAKEARAKLDKQYENVEKTYEKIPLMQQRIEAIKAEQSAIEALNNARDKEIENNVKLLNTHGLEATYDSGTDTLHIDNLEHINDLKGKDQEATNKLIKEVEDLVRDTQSLAKENKELANTWQDNIYNIQKLTKEYEELQRTMHTEKMTDFNFGMDIANAQQDLDRYVGLAKGAIAEILLELNRAYDAGLTNADDYVQELIKSLLSATDSLKSSVSGIWQQKHDDYNAAYRAVTGVIDDKIKKLQKEQDALRKLNDEEQRAQALAKAREELDKARNQKTIQVYRKGQGWVWESDQDAIKSAEEKIADLLNQEKIQDIQDQIDAWEDYKDEWDSVVRNCEQQADRMKAIEIFGKDWEEEINNQRLDNLRDFESEYMEINKNLAEIAQMTSNEILQAYGFNVDLDKILNPTYEAKNRNYYYATQNGSAPKGAKVGDRILTQGGTFEIVQPGTAGANYNPTTGLWSKKVDNKYTPITAENAGMLAFVEPVKVLNNRLTESTDVSRDMVTQALQTSGILNENNSQLADNMDVLHYGCDVLTENTQELNALPPAIEQAISNGIVTGVNNSNLSSMNIPPNDQVSDYVVGSDQSTTPSDGQISDYIIGSDQPITSMNGQVSDYIVGSDQPLQQTNTIIKSSNEQLIDQLEGISSNMDEDNQKIIDQIIKATKNPDNVQIGEYDETGRKVVGGRVTPDGRVVDKEYSTSDADYSQTIGALKTTISENNKALAQNVDVLDENTIITKAAYHEMFDELAKENANPHVGYNDGQYYNNYEEYRNSFNPKPHGNVQGWYDFYDKNGYLIVAPEDYFRSGYVMGNPRGYTDRERAEDTLRKAEEINYTQELKDSYGNYYQRLQDIVHTPEGGDRKAVTSAREHAERVYDEILNSKQNPNKTVGGSYDSTGKKVISITVDRNGNVIDKGYSNNAPDFSNVADSIHEVPSAEDIYDSEIFKTIYKQTIDPNNDYFNYDPSKAKYGNVDATRAYDSSHNVQYDTLKLPELKSGDVQSNSKRLMENSDAIQTLTNEFGSDFDRLNDSLGDVVEVINKQGEIVGTIDTHSGSIHVSSPSHGSSNTSSNSSSVNGNLSADGTYREDYSQADIDGIKQAQKDYNDAKAKGDIAGMDAAHNRAEEIRKKNNDSSGSNGVIVVKHARGTKFAKKEYALVDDEYAGATELVVHNNGVGRTTQLEYGDQVFPHEESKAILDTYEMMTHGGADNTYQDAIPVSIEDILHVSHPINIIQSDFKSFTPPDIITSRFNAFITRIIDNIQSLITHLGAIENHFEHLEVNCPNITNGEEFMEFLKNIQNIKVDAYTRSNRR